MFALVDEEDFERLSRYRWKAKPNGGMNHVYAVRNTTTRDGRHLMVRMHREVLRYTGDLDIDHINRNALDNRRANLRIVSRSVNSANRGVWEREIACPKCGAKRVRVAKVSDSRPALCEACKDAARRDAADAKQTHRSICQHCARTFEANRIDMRFCSEKCKKRAKRNRQIAAGALPPSATAAGQRARRAKRKHLKVLPEHALGG
jgi:hypothetical protein